MSGSTLSALSSPPDIILPGGMYPGSPKPLARSGREASVTIHLTPAIGDPRREHQ